MAISEQLSKQLVPSDSESIARFYEYFWKWQPSLIRDSIPEKEVQVVREGGFCVTNVIHLEPDLRLFVIVVAPAKNSDLNNRLLSIAMDTAIQHIFQGHNILSDRSFILALTDYTGVPLLSSMHIVSSWSPPEIHPVVDFSDKPPMFYFMNRPPSSEFSYLFVVSARDSALNIAFDEPIEQENPKSREYKTIYHSLYEVTKTEINLLRIDDLRRTKTILSYRFDGKRFETGAIK
jgi:hypothetical protein